MSNPMLPAANHCSLFVQMPRRRTKIATVLRLVFVWMVFASVLRVSTAADTYAPTLQGERFKDLVPFDSTAQFIIGATFNYPHLGTAAEDIFKNDFQVLTPGNASKQTACIPVLEYGGGKS